jgi:hypothetical protein
MTIILWNLYHWNRLYSENRVENTILAKLLQNTELALLISPIFNSCHKILDIVGNSTLFLAPKGEQTTFYFVHVLDNRPTQNLFGLLNCLSPRVFLCTSTCYLKIKNACHCCRSATDYLQYEWGQAHSPRNLLTTSCSFTRLPYKNPLSRHKHYISSYIEYPSTISWVLWLLPMKYFLYNKGHVHIKMWIHWPGSLLHS